MDPNFDGESIGGDRLSEHDRRTLVVLERSVRSPGLIGLWRRVKFRLLVAWGTRLAISVGLVVSVVALVVMWADLSTHIGVAVAGEGLLTAGALLLAHGIRMWRLRRHERLQPGG